MSTYLGVSVRLWLLWAVAAVGLSAAVVSSGLISPQSECELLYVEPSSPEPSVAVWRAVWDCGGEILSQHYAADSVWECGATYSPELGHYVEADCSTAAQCGYVLEEVVWLERSCVSEEELAERLAVIREERSGQRDWSATLGEAERRAECVELLAARDWDGAGCAGEWADLRAAAELLWGPDADPETGGLE